jgi:tripartite-type tricarboxylate transporter receptor subunit TctC
MKRRSLLSALAASAAWTAAPRFAFAQPLNTRIVVPFAPGGATDTLARLMAEPLAQEFGHPVVVENRAGAGGSIGMAEVARARADGRTLGLATVSTHGVNPVVYKKLPYDAIRDFAPVGELARAPMVMLVHPSVPAGDMGEFLRYAKKNPGKLTYGSPGVGSAGQMAAEIFKRTTGSFILHIPYRGAGPMVSDLLGGQVQIAFDQVTSALQHVKQGRLRALAVAWNKRLVQLPDVPTFAELALFSNNEPSWFGLVAPAETPRAVLIETNAILRRVLASSTLRARLEAVGLYPSAGTPQEFAIQIRKQIDQMQRIARFAGISLD